MKDFLERLKSPVVWIAALTSAYTYIEVTDFATAREYILVALGILIALFSALNNPTDRDNM